MQSASRGNDDDAYHRNVGIQDALVPRETLLAHDAHLVVSGRLHGALESVLQGRPAYHVSYERKGFGAYANQHLDDSVVNGAAFDPDLVA
ncbi:MULTISPECIES: hypothetical protein [Burkholderia]|uniref:Polysaccharide pyruvyl transferase domain-containing protein n=1 Tax=Burkholderia pyrrocinia TaxID=60550 RepID=A0A318IU78_BURPY|nr:MULTISPECIES: hypothetical protein [Burkholderia]PXX38160.1 hypothetical protein NA66_1003138 [Burkholderia pyrrocinia]SFW53420.1 hypothetical protein SAMN03159384_02681 [Burkholderia sp. NFACC33-1]SFX58277.1 hypothetical protein SAMN03159408_01679 [Burkholderia sp. NFPP32]